MSKATPAYVLDTSAWLTLIEDEAGSDTVQEILEQAKADEAVVLVSFMSFMEVYYIGSPERTYGCLKGLGTAPHFGS